LRAGRKKRTPASDESGAAAHILLARALSGY